MTNSDNPWHAIRPAGNIGLISARRVDALGKWNLFWARDNQGHCILLFKHAQALSLGESLPRPKGVELVRTNDGAAAILVLRLLDGSLREPFHALCRDLVAATELHTEEHLAVATFIARTWRWHHLLRGGQRLLSIQEQKGLVGELLTLRDVILPKVGPLAGVQAWCGPLGGAQDFRFDGLAIECKASGGAKHAVVEISSKHQLDAGHDNLFLRVLDIQEADAETIGSFTLLDLAQQIANEMTNSGPAASDALQCRLDAMGFDPEEDYAGRFWKAGRTLTAAVIDGFPRLIPTTLPEAVSRVSYAISVSACQPFAVEEEKIWQGLTDFGAR